MSLIAFAQHLNSSTHRPKDVPCPGCEETFVSRSAMVHHLEYGKCPSGVNRRIVDNAIRQYDRNNVITNPARLLTGGDPSDNTYTATRRAWNGSAFECYFCHSEFRTLPSLNQHLASPRHQTKNYICPLNTCRQTFKTLSGLCQHIESEKCGVLRFKGVRRAMDKVLGGAQRGMLTY